jgi:hypothetical protein
MLRLEARQLLSIAAMHSSSKFSRAALLGFATLLAQLATATSVAAQTRGRTELFLSSAAENKAISLLSDGAGPRRAYSAEVDYAVFATELLAYLTKEVFRDSANEFDNSLLGTHLSRSMPDQHSEFGSHCLMIIRRIGSQLATPITSSSLAVDSPAMLDYAARAATAGLALRQVWSAFQNHVEDDRSGVSLSPKVSSRRIGVSVTLHW